MEWISQGLQSLNIYFNYYSFGNLLAFIFTLLAGLFLLTLKQKSKSTTALGLGFLLLSPFNLAYFVAYSYYDPMSSYHRWFTVGLILLPLTHFVQWAFKYPTNSRPLVARIVFYAMYAVAFAFTGYFVWLSFQAEHVFLLNGHLWDFNVDRFSSMFGKVILLYMVIIGGSGAWKFFQIKDKERWTVFWVILGILVAALTPGLMNVLQRDGAISRAAFITAFVTFTVAGYFFILIFYINRTTDRTSFMVKIVGISLVTFLLMMQMLSLITLEDREEEYNALRAQYTARALEGGYRSPEIEYIARYDISEDSVGKIYSTAGGDSWDIGLEAHKEDLFNTHMYEEIRRLEPTGFRQSVQNLLSARARPFFAGYGNAIRDFVENQSELQGEELQSALVEEFETFDATARVAYNQIHSLPEQDFREALVGYVNGKRNSFFGGETDFAPFAAAIETHLRNYPDQEGTELRRETLRFLAPFTPQYHRHYRKLANESAENFKHFTAFTQYIPEQNAVYEAGFSYVKYRKYMHNSAFQQIMLFLVVLFVLLIIFPLFFQGSLIKPLYALVGGVRKVNDGDLETQVPIKVQDEIGFLAYSFNSMVVSIREAREKLQDYANNLEEKVKERTAELNETLEKVRALKTQQDGDYFLTSLLQRPLNYNANKSRLVNTDFYLEQKKKFEFRNKRADLGGDICLTGNLRIGQPHNYRRYTVAMNGDAMGKSMQGAGGSLVMGVVMNSIMARSAKGDRVLDTTPEQWLTDVYEELHGVFQAFNGSMVISCITAVIDDETGEMWYFNAEHPHTILYRNGKASFIEEELLLRKVGLESEIPFEVRRFQLEPGDVVIMGSDGRDDLDLTPNQAIRTINEDEFLILKRVEESDGDLERLVSAIRAYGELTDDLSLLRLGFQEQPLDRRSKGDRRQTTERRESNGAAARQLEGEVDAERTIIDIDVHDEYEEIYATELEEQSAEFEEYFREGRRLAREGRFDEALEHLNKAYEIRNDVPSLNKIMAVVTFKERDYSRAIEILDRYLEFDPGIADFWLYLSISHKRIGEYDRALQAANRVLDMHPERVVNLINLADIHQKLGNEAEAREFVERALSIDPQNRQAKSLQSALA